MHYPKVLERVDSPEQIFHRSFPLGAPEYFGHCSWDTPAASRVSFDLPDLSRNEDRRRLRSQGAVRDEPFLTQSQII